MLPLGLEKPTEVTVPGNLPGSASAEPGCAGADAVDTDGADECVAGGMVCVAGASVCGAADDAVDDGADGADDCEDGEVGDDCVPGTSGDDGSDLGAGSDEDADSDGEGEISSLCRGASVPGVAAACCEPGSTAPAWAAAIPAVEVPAHPARAPMPTTATATTRILMERGFMAVPVLLVVGDRTQRPNGAHRTVLSPLTRRTAPGMRSVPTKFRPGLHNVARSQVGV